MIWGGKVRYLSNERYVTYTTIKDKYCIDPYFLRLHPYTPVAASPLIIYVWLGGQAKAPDNTDSQPGDNI